MGSTQALESANESTTNQNHSHDAKIATSHTANETNTLDIENVDSVVTSVLEKIIQRSKFGKEKYGTDLDRTDLTVKDWITHAQEELMDGILYLEKLRKQFP